MSIKTEVCGKFFGYAQKKPHKLYGLEISKNHVQVTDNGQTMSAPTESHAFTLFNTLFSGSCPERSRRLTE